MNSFFRAFGLFCCALVVVILCAQPQFLESVSPGWQQSWGVVLFAFASIGTIISGFRMLKVLLGFVVWSGMAAIIGLAVFENKLPAAYLHEGLGQAGSALAAQINSDGFSTQIGRMMSVVLSKTTGKDGAELSAKLPRAQVGTSAEMMAHAQEALVLGQVVIPQ